MSKWFRVGQADGWVRVDDSEEMDAGWVRDVYGKSARLGVMSYRIELVLALSPSRKVKGR
jgi:hypothetical protein